MFYREYGSLGESYFEGGDADETHPAGYTSYSNKKTDKFGAYAGLLRDILEMAGRTPTEENILLLGCAYGHTVAHLVDNGVDAWGMDISAFAVANAPDSIADRILQGNGGKYADLQMAAETAGVEAFDAIIDAGLLCYFTDEGAVDACRAMRATSPLVVHRVRTNSDLTGDAEEWYNTKTLDEWRDLCDPHNADIWVENEEFRQEWEKTHRAGQQPRGLQDRGEGVFDGSSGEE